MLRAARLRTRALSLFRQRPGARHGRDRRVCEDPARQEIRRDPWGPYRRRARLGDHPRAGGGARERVHGRGGRTRDPRPPHDVGSGGASGARFPRPGCGHVSGTPKDPVAVVLGWRRSRPVEDVWQRGVISVLAAVGALLVGLLAAVADRLLGFAGLVAWGVLGAVIGAAASRWAIAGAAGRGPGGDA